MTRSIRLVMCLLILAAFARRSEAQGSSCRAFDAGAMRLRSYIRELVTSTAADRVKLRHSLGLSTMDSTRVVVVTDNSVCEKIARGIDASVRKAGVTRRLYVVSAGSRFAAQDPGHPSGEWWPTSILDSTYKVTGVVMAP